MEMKRSYTQATVLNAEFVEEKTKIGSVCEHAWREQRPAGDWEGFLKNWKPVVDMAKKVEGFLFLRSFLKE